MEGEGESESESGNEGEHLVMGRMRGKVSVMKVRV